MPRKSQVEKKPLERVSHRPSRSFPVDLSDENLTSVAVPRKTRATSEVKKPPLETPKMADNLGRLHSKAVADPAATSNKSAANRLELTQTRKTRRSLDASKEKPEGFKLSVAASVSPIKAPKRSQAPLPPSDVEGAKKRKIAPPRMLPDNPKPKPLDAKLPVAVAASKPLEGKPSPAKEAPKNLKEDKENAKKSPKAAVVRVCNVRLPLSQSNGQAPAAKKGVSSVAEIEEPPFGILESCARGMLGPSGDDVYFLNSLQHFYKRYRDCNTTIGKRLLNLSTSNTQKHWEIESLKNRLNTTRGQVKDLTEKLSEQTERKKEFGEKYLGALKARTACEKDFESKLQMSKLLADKQMTELDEKRSIIGDLRGEINNMQETHRGMASVLSDVERKLKQTEETVAQLLGQNNKLIAELQERKLGMEQMVAEKGVFKRQISQLESELKEKVLRCSELNLRLVEFQELQLLLDETTKQLKLARDEKISMETLLGEKETIHMGLKESIKELEAAKVSLTEINEVCAKELEAGKSKSSMELKAQKEAFDDTILKLNARLNQQLLDFANLSQRHETLQADNLHQLSLHNGELKKCEMENNKLKENIQSLENRNEELQVQNQSLQAEQSENLAKLLAATNHVGVVTSEFKDEKERYEAQIAALEADSEEQHKVWKVDQETIQSLMAELEEAAKRVSDLKGEKEQMANEFAAAKIKFEEEKKCQQNAFSELQEELKTKETELIGLEHEKNGIISQLEQRINRIGSVFGEPITSATMPRSTEARKSSKRSQRNLQQEVHAATPTSSQQKRKPPRTTGSKDVSDFESEDDEMPVKLLFSNRGKLAIVKPQGDDLFDALKRSTN